MALVLAIEGKGVIANCDAVTNDTGGTGTGDWTEEGGGTISLSNDVYLFGGSAIGGKYASKAGFHQFNLGVGNELDFGPGGTEEGQFLYIWIAMTAIGTLDTLSTFALCVRFSSNDPGTSAYRDYLIAGNDGSNGWTGGFKLFVIDPTIPPSRQDTGFDISSILTVGVWIDCSTSARADSIFTDQLAVGKGLRILGSGSEAWAESVEYCTDYSTRAWGMLQEREGIYYAYGKMHIGDTAQTTGVIFEDDGKVIQFGQSEFYRSGEWVSSVPDDFHGIVVEDAATYPTTFSDGVLVGTDQGRAGTVFIGHTGTDVSLDLHAGSDTGSISTLYGTSLKTITGPITVGDNDYHAFYNVSFAGCSQFKPSGSFEIRNCIFAETADVSGALEWYEGIDISNCRFLANTIGAGIEMTGSAGSPYAYNALFFDGNQYDVNNSSASAISINKNNLSDPTSYTGSTVTFLGTSVTTQINVSDIDSGAAISGARVLVLVGDGSNFPYEDTVTIAGAGTTATVTHTSHDLSNGEYVQITGCAGVGQNVYNGVYSITVSDANTYTYTTNETIVSTPASGDPRATLAIISDTTNAAGVVSDLRSYAINQPIVGRVRRASGGAYYRQAPIADTVDKDTGKSINVQLIPDE